MSQGPSVYYCPVCGIEVRAKYEYCPECGAACWLNPKDAWAELFARIHSDGEPVVTDELSKIEYLLEALGQAHEAGELPASAYRLLTRRYLGRAREVGLKRSKEAETTPAAASEGTVAPSTSAYDELVIPSWPPESFEPAPQVPQRAAPRPASPPPPIPRSPKTPGPPKTPRPPLRISVAARSVPWTVWVALAGAVLVIAAAAGFAVVAWPSLSAGIRLGILVGVTAVLYGGGLWLRRRLAVIGISLLALGAALVLVDGWLLLSAGHLHSLWWWTLLFAIGSAVHWGMGQWLRVGLFALTGAVAQIAWWWLLGTALSWPLGARAAILTTVGLIWTLAAARVQRGTARSIGQVLGLLGPGLAAGAAVVGIIGGLVHSGWSAVIAALVISITATAALELQKVADGRWVREASVVALLPVPVALLALQTMGSVWLSIVLMVFAGGACLFLSAWHGGAFRALAGLFTLLAAPAVPGLMGHGGAGPWIGAVASWLALGTLAVVGGSLLPRTAPGRFERDTADISRMMQGGGWLVVLGASVLQVVALGVSEPLMAGSRPSSGALTLLAAEAAAAWLLSTAMRSRIERSVGAGIVAGAGGAPGAAADVARPTVVVLTVTGLAGYAYSQFAAALAVHWIAPGAAHVWYSFVTLGLAAAWSHARTLAMRRLLDMSSQVAVWMFGLSTIGAAVFAIAPALLRSSHPGLGYVLLAALAAVLWGLEAWRFRERVFLVAASVASSVTIYLAAWGIGGRYVAGLATVVAALILLPLPATLRLGEPRLRTMWTAPSMAVALIAAVTLVHRPALTTVGLLVLAVAAVGANVAERSRSASGWVSWPADAGVACAVFAVITVLFPIGRHAGLAQLGLAWGVASVGSFVFEVWTRIRGRFADETTAVVIVPLLAWALVAVGRGAPVWTAAAGLGSAFPVLALAWWRGGHTRVLAGGVLLAVELPVVVVHAFGASGWNKAAVVLGTELVLGLCCLFVSLRVRTALRPESRWEGAHDLRRVFGAEAWPLMAGAAAVLVPAVEVSWRDLSPPVSLSAVSGLALAVWVTAGAARWRAEKRRGVQPQTSPSVLARDAAAAIVAYALSLQLATIIERRLQLPTHLAWIAAAMFVAGLIWSHLRRPVRRLLGCPEPVVEVMWALTSSVLAAVVLFGALGRHAAPDYVSGSLLAMAGLAWSAEAVRFGRLYYIPAASAALAAAVGLFGWSAGGRAAGALAAAIAGAVLGLSPLVLRRKVEWGLWWSLGASVAAAGGVAASFSTPWSATLALAALGAALAGPALLGLPALAGLSAFAGFAAVCSLESWTGANAWVGTAVAIVASAGLVAPAAVRRGRPQPGPGAVWSLALTGALTLVSVLVATAVAGSKSASPAWLSGGDWSLAVLLCALAAYCAGWSLSARAKWGLAAGAVVLLAGLLVFLRAANVGAAEAYFAVSAVWCGVVAWRLSRRKRYRHVTRLLDIVAVLVGLGGPAALMVASRLSGSSTGHAIWLICLGAGMVGAGVGLRIRLHFGFGLGGVVLAAFWLTSSHLSAIPSVVAVVAIVGVGLITLGAVGERRRARLALVARNAFAGWR